MHHLELLLQESLRLCNKPCSPKQLNPNTVNQKLNLKADTKNHKKPEIDPNYDKDNQALTKKLYLDSSDSDAKINSKFDIINQTLKKLLNHKKIKGNLKEPLTEKEIAYVATELNKIRRSLVAIPYLAMSFQETIRDQLQLLYKEFTGIPAQVTTGDELRNVNSYEYLQYIFQASTKLLQTNSIFRYISTRVNQKYNEKLAYGDLYTEFLYEVERLIENNEVNALDPEDAEFIDRIYNNKNLALERSHQLIQPTISKVRQTSKKFNSSVFSQLIGGGSLRNFINHYFFKLDDVNEITPQSVGSIKSEILASTSAEFKPQFTSSQPSVRSYAYKRSKDPLELRFGTQGQFVDHTARLNPIFKKWLDIQKVLKPGKTINHIYFNNLPRERKPIFDFWPFNTDPKVRESKLTAQLEKLNDEPNSNIAVITFPSDEGLMSRHLIENRNPSIPYQVALDQMLNLAKEKGNRNLQIKDFHIPDHIRVILYRSKKYEDKKLRELLDKSFQAMGLSPKNKLSPAQNQAVLFYFLKYELTKFIIKKIQPNSYNFACKDAIDRSGASSVVFNLLRSIERGKPMSRAEFERGLHGAPVLVKGRGMNHHTNIVWNMVDVYLMAHRKSGNAKNQQTVPDWLSEWHKENALPGSIAAKERKVEKQQLKDRAKNTPPFSFSQFYSFFKPAPTVKPIRPCMPEPLQEGRIHRSKSIRIA